MPSSPMHANAAKNQGNGAMKMKMSRGGSKSKPSHCSSWGAMAMGYYSSSSSSSSSSSCKKKEEARTAVEEAGGGGKNMSCGGGGGESKVKKKRGSISISRSMNSAASSICSSKDGSVFSSKGSRLRRSGGESDAGNTSSRRTSSLKSSAAATDYAAVSASSSFNSEATAATSATTASSSSPPPSSSSVLSSPLSSIGGSFRAMQLRKLSGCVECHSALDPRSLAAAAAVFFSCSDCDEVFLKPDSLDLHRATRHAVSELGSEDTSRNIVEIIFQSSWLKKQAPPCKIERILKVNSTAKTIKSFEEYKESIKEKARASNVDDDAKKNPRCVADGNELLRFHSTTFSCSLGLAGATALCSASAAGAATPPRCKLCAIIKDGFRVDGDGRIATMATSGRAHDTADAASSEGEKRAMLVCRVVAGRVSKVKDSVTSSEECDSVSSSGSQGVIYSDLDQLCVFNPRAILPCFVVIYSGF